MAERDDQQNTGRLPALREDALAWHQRLSDADANADAALWQMHAEWLAADPAHLAEFDRIAAIFERVDAAAPAVAAHFAAPRRHRRFIAPDHALAGFALAVLALLMTGGLTYRLLTAPQALRFATATGELRAVILPDGSTAELDTGTVLNIAFSDDVRAGELRRGRAVFDMRHDPGRPFLLKVRGQEVQGLDTRFEVTANADRVSIAVARGVLGVRPQNAPRATAPARLAPGEKLVFTPAADQPHRETVDPQGIGAWMQHRLVFKETPLATVLQEINRYYPGTAFRVDDDDVAALPFTGSLHVEDKASLARSLSDVMDLRYRRDGDGFVLGAAADNDDDTQD